MRKSENIVYCKDSELESSDIKKYLLTDHCECFLSTLCLDCN